MEISATKKIIGSMERCYALNRMETIGGVKYIVASEAVQGACKIYAEPSYEEETVWDQIGGTMSIVPLNQLTGNQEAFLISQKYFPGFEAKESKIVKMVKEAEGWISEEVLVLPYLHRFELFNVEGITYIVCSTLCTWKISREDWSSPGQVYVGVYHQETNEVTDFRLVLSNISKNHGMTKVIQEEQERIVVSSEDGIFQIFVEDGSYRFKKIFDINSSETVFVDINNDGVDEVVVIQPFHGDSLGIYDQKGKLLQQIQRETQFLHSLWGGKVGNTSIIVCGARRGMSDLIVGYFDESGIFQTYVVDSGIGSANIIVEQVGNTLKIISANNSINEIAVYTLNFS